MDASTATVPATDTPAAATDAPAERKQNIAVVLQGDAIIGAGGIKTDTLNMRRPKVKDRLNVARVMTGKSEEEKEVAFIANLCGLAPSDVENLDFDDYNRLQDALMSF